MRFLRQNTDVHITVGPFLDKTDGVTPEITLTVTSCLLTMTLDDDDNSAVNLIIDAAPTASGGNNDMVHITSDAAGFYDLELTAAQTNYTGRVMLAITDAATHCPVFHEFTILAANVYDSLFAGAGPTADLLDVNVSKLGETTQTGRDIGTNVLISSGTGTGQLSVLSGVVAASGNWNTTVPDAAGTAAGLHGTTDGLIGALVTPDAAGTAAGLHATTDGLIGALVTPDAAGTAAGLHATTDGLIGALVVPDAAGTAAGLHATTDGLIGGLVVPDVAGTAAGLHATTDGLIGTAQTDLDTLTGSDGVTLATAQGNYAPSTHDAAAVKTTIEAVGSSLAQILADTNELQADWADAGRLDAILDTAAAIGGGGVTVDANIVSISDDTGAADTLEAFLDGTGADLSPSMLISKNIPLADAS